MKEHINSSQLNELTDEGKEKLRGWAKDKPILLSEYSDPTFTVMKLPFLSIGQMIGFLGDANCRIRISFYEKQPAQKQIIEIAAWIVTPTQRIVTDWFGENLCDTLWEGVVNILNGKYT